LPISKRHAPGVIEGELFITEGAKANIAEVAAVGYRNGQLRGNHERLWPADPRWGETGSLVTIRIVAASTMAVPVGM